MSTPSPKTPLNDEQLVRYQSLKEDLKALEEGSDASIPAPRLDDELLARLVVGGSAHATLPLSYLARCGLSVSAPSQVSDEELSQELWKVIWVMGLLRLFLDYTDHMTDRELYTFLYEDALKEPTAFMPGEETPPHYHIEPLGGCSLEDNRRMLAYYHDRMDKVLYDELATLFDEPVEKLERPADRDRLLP